jgi:hypothetical protein
MASQELLPQSLTKKSQPWKVIWEDFTTLDCKAPSEDGDDECLHGGQVRLWFASERGVTEEEKRARLAETMLAKYGETAWYQQKPEGGFKLAGRCSICGSSPCRCNTIAGG